MHISTENSSGKLFHCFTPDEKFTLIMVPSVFSSTEINSGKLA